MNAKVISNFLYAVSCALMLNLGTAAIAETIDSKVDMLGVPKYLKISGLSSSTKNKLLILNLEVTNTDDRDNTAYYRVNWLDDSGDIAWEEESWKPLLIHGNQKIRLRAVAPTQKAKNFKIEFSAEANNRN